MLSNEVRINKEDHIMNQSMTPCHKRKTYNLFILNAGKKTGESS